MRTLSPRLNLGKLILALALLSAIIALANTLLASYRVQRDQLVGNTLKPTASTPPSWPRPPRTSCWLPSRNWLCRHPARPGQPRSEHRAQDEASRLQLQTNSFNSSLVVDADGLVIATSPQTLQLQGEVLHSVGNNAALAARQPMISDPYQSATGKRAGVAVAPDLRPPGPLPRLRQRHPVPAPAQRLLHCWASTTTATVPTCTWSTVMVACCTTPMASGWATTWSAIRR
jgi:hypothetical protein